MMLTIDRRPLPLHLPATTTKKHERNENQIRNRQRTGHKHAPKFRGKCTLGGEKRAKASVTIARSTLQPPSVIMGAGTALGFKFAVENLLSWLAVLREEGLAQESNVKVNIRGNIS